MCLSDLSVATGLLLLLTYIAWINDKCMDGFSVNCFMFSLVLIIWSHIVKLAYSPTKKVWVTRTMSTEHTLIIYVVPKVNDIMNINICFCLDSSAYFLAIKALLVVVFFRFLIETLTRNREMNQMKFLTTSCFCICCLILYGDQCLLTTTHSFHSKGSCVTCFANNIWSYMTLLVRDSCVFMVQFSGFCCCCCCCSFFLLSVIKFVTRWKFI